MPKNKKKAAASSDSDSGPEDRGPAPKKPKTSSSSKKDEAEPTWAIDKRRFLKVREFKGKIYVDIREFYEADGDLKPGKKGISLSVEQWNKLKEAVPEVDEAIQHKC